MLLTHDPSRDHGKLISFWSTGTFANICMIVVLLPALILGQITRRSRYACAFKHEITDQVNQKHKVPIHIDWATVDCHTYKQTLDTALDDI